MWVVHKASFRRYMCSPRVFTKEWNFVPVGWWRISTILYQTTFPPPPPPFFTRLRHGTGPKNESEFWSHCCIFISGKGNRDWSWSINWHLLAINNKSLMMLRLSSALTIMMKLCLGCITSDCRWEVLSDVGNASKILFLISPQKLEVLNGLVSFSKLEFVH